MTDVDKTKEVVDSLGLVGSALEQRYRIDRVVAEGGFGVVYVGHHVSLDVPVAVKVLKVSVTSSGPSPAGVVERFQKEAQTIARLRHPAIVQVMDTGLLEVAGVPTGLPFMVLEWVEGETLGNLLDGRKGAPAYSPRQCLALLRPALEAIAFAHENGVVHRDLKPSNIMIVKGGAGASVRVLDFGIAKVMRPEEDAGTGVTQTKETMRAFTLLYAAPEQVSGSRTGFWTDVHAIALMMTEMLTGQSGYPSMEVNELYRLVFDPVRPSPGRVGVDVGPWESTLRRALAITPGHRFPNARELLNELVAGEADAEAAYQASVLTTGPLKQSLRVRAEGGDTGAATATTVSADASAPAHLATTRRTRRGAGLVALLVAAGVLGAGALAVGLTGGKGTLDGGIATGAPTIVAEGAAPTPPAPALLAAADASAPTALSDLSKPGISAPAASASPAFASPAFASPASPPSRRAEARGRGLPPPSASAPPRPVDTSSYTLE